MDPKKPYYCDICDRHFPKADWLQNHLKGKPHARVLASKNPPPEEGYPETLPIMSPTTEDLKEWGYNDYMPGAKKMEETFPKEPSERYQPSHHQLFIDESTQDVPSLTQPTDFTQGVPPLTQPIDFTQDVNVEDWLSPLVGLAPWEPRKEDIDHPLKKEAQKKETPKEKKVVVPTLKRQNAAIGEELKRKLEEEPLGEKKPRKQPEFKTPEVPKKVAFKKPELLKKPEVPAPTPVTLTIDEDGIQLKEAQKGAGGVKCILMQDGTVQGKLVIPCTIDFKNM